MAHEKQEEVILPHHEQQVLCTTRLPYRQGRQLTAIKVYTVNDESNHLLIFGVPSLKLRQEVKSQFGKFGKLKQFAVTTGYPIEPFTENYHAIFENIHCARLAKKKLDTKNFYGGLLHVCYAPELEQLTETRNKIQQRQKDVLNRLKNLQKETTTKIRKVEKVMMTSMDNILSQKSNKLNMGEMNIIGVGRQIRDVVINKPKRKNVQRNVVIEKRFKPCFTTDIKETCIQNTDIEETSNKNDEIEIIDCSSVDVETITNINESLNYKNFGNEVIKKIPQKPVNKIKFNIGKKGP